MVFMTTVNSEIENDNKINVDSSSFLSLQAKLEGIIFASPKPIPIEEMISYIGDDVDIKEVQGSLKELLKLYSDPARGFVLEFYEALGYQFRTSKHLASVMEKMFSSRPKPLSRAAQETLAIIAYRQPVTRADIEFIRGVDAGSIIKNLLDRNLIQCVGRKEDVGRPMIFGTTDEFLRVFSLKKLSDLKPLDAFQPAPEVLETANREMTSEKELDKLKELEDSVPGAQSEELKEASEDRPSPSI